MRTKIINILMVDDDPVDSRLVKQILKRSSQTTEFMTETAESLANGLDYLKRHSFDLVLLDLNLPDSQGLETVQKTHVVNPDIPIVVLTGLDDEQIGLDAIRKGAEDYLTKGDSLKYTLVRAIRYAIERKQSRKFLEQAEAKSHFVSTVSHELRTPLTCMKESVAILLDRIVGEVNNDQKKFLNILKRNIDRLTRLINNVLDFQKIEADKMKFDMQENDINEVVGEIKETMISLANRKGLNLLTRLDDTLPKVDFDRDKIIQVLTNLVNNAIKFTDKGDITISTAKIDNTVRVSVQDTGCGIKKEDMSKLFHEFEQLLNLNERTTGGTGLGLAICRKIIEEHGEKIWAVSESGKGTTFNFLLPVRQ